MRRLLLVTVMLFSAICTGIPQPEKAAADRGLLPLEEFISLACRRDTAFQEILIDEMYLRYRKDIDLPARDIVLSVAGQYDLMLGDDNDRKSGGISLSRLFPRTGTDVSAGYTSTPNTQGGVNKTTLTLSLSQPIARNAFGRANRLQEKITGIEIDLAGHQVVEAYEDYLAAVINLYFDWYSDWENLQYGESSYRYNRELLRDIRKKQQFRIARRVDVNKISLQVIQKREELVSLKEGYSRSLNLVKNAIRHTRGPGPVPVMPDLPGSTRPDFSRDYSRFTTGSRTMRMLSLLERHGLLSVSLAADALLPSANLVAGFSSSSQGIGYSSAATNISGSRTSGDSAFAGISMSWNFIGQKERALHKTAQIDLKKSRLSSRSKKAELETDLKNLYAQILSERELIEIARKKIDLSAAVAADERRNYLLGKITLNDLIQAVNDLDRNRISLVAHRVQLNRLMVEWLRLSDRLISKKDIAQPGR